ncbi:hypothetical protein N7470_003208 [Penicillium chermesinum]|nr:hypothetical protein N7470_003208 [Penicillium chermesinum]
MLKRSIYVPAYLAPRGSPSRLSSWDLVCCPGSLSVVAGHLRSVSRGTEPHPFSLQFAITLSPSSNGVSSYNLSGL